MADELNVGVGEIVFFGVRDVVLGAEAEVAMVLDWFGKFDWALDQELCRERPVARHHDVLIVDRFLMLGARGVRMLAYRRTGLLGIRGNTVKLFFGGDEDEGLAQEGARSFGLS